MSISNSLTPALISEFQGFRLVLCTRLASAVIIIYDHMLTLDREVTTIWPSKWSLAKVLFLTNRYFALSAAIFSNYVFFTPHLTDVVSSRFFQYEGWVGLIACMLAEAILQLRLYAIYSMDKKFLCLMLTFFLACAATSAWIMGSSLSLFITAPALIPTPFGPFCFGRKVVPHFYTYWIPLLSCESLLCTLAVIQGVRSFKGHGSILHRGYGLLNILIRDSVMYFFGVGIVYLTCLVVWIKAPETFLEAPIGFSIALSSTLGSRLILNIREAPTTVELSQISSDYIRDVLHFDSGSSTVSNTIVDIEGQRVSLSYE
ncbi:hypothetical protein GALMADRAFT_927278 [Galerina marginata CBS 339.88]|uniref:DUF6533 domain-containing protein n=1 Tax=Galerina marginata (strain CBS 339.88) TaxID=685588 RepID=A0A067SR73_GALM3|nr:hypothetical protein GALMADRAFT_927278 [Galerina marginata CBS 339.88]